MLPFRSGLVATRVRAVSRCDRSLTRPAPLAFSPPLLLPSFSRPRIKLPLAFLVREGVVCVFARCVYSHSLSSLSLSAQLLALPLLPLDFLLSVVSEGYIYFIYYDISYFSLEFIIFFLFFILIHLFLFIYYYFFLFIFSPSYSSLPRTGAKPAGKKMIYFFNYLLFIFPLTFFTLFFFRNSWVWTSRR